MNTVRKGVVALLVVGFLCLLNIGGTAQAVIGIPDDVPASTLLFPFFKTATKPTATDRQDTLIVVTNTANLATSLHVTIWTVNSKAVYGFNVTLGPKDVFSCSLLDLLIPAGITRPCGVIGDTPPAPSVLTITVGNEQLLAGYVTADVVSGTTSLFPGQSGYPFREWNILIGHMYLVNLPKSFVTGINAVSLESVKPDAGKNAKAVTGQYQGFYLTRCIEAGNSICDKRERIDGPNGDFADTGTAGGLIGLSGDSPLSLIIRRIAGGIFNTEVWLWKDRNTSGVSVNVVVYDEAENAFATTLPLQNEINVFTDASFGVPKSGWVRIRFTCAEFGSCGFNPANPVDAQTVPIQSVAYALQSIRTPVAGDAAFPAHRYYSTYIGGLSEE